MTALKRISLKLLISAALLITSTVLFSNAKASRLSCSACAAAVKRDSALCYQLQAQANDECGIFWVIDPCETTPAEVCVSGCTCD